MRGAVWWNRVCQVRMFWVLPTSTPVARAEAHAFIATQRRPT